eukprot:1143438-Pelagomonas_calceolata.AAC.3
MKDFHVCSPLLSNLYTPPRSKPPSEPWSDSSTLFHHLFMLFASQFYRLDLNVPMKFKWYRDELGTGFADSKI